MNVLLLITSALFFLWIIRKTIFWVFLWQLKEYRFDRIFIHLRETHQGKQILLSPLFFLKVALIFSYLFIVLNPQWFPFYHFGISVVYLIQVILVGKELYFRSFKRPVPTVKALAVIFITLVVIEVLYSLSLFDIYFWLLILDITATFLIFGIVGIFSFPTELYRDIKVGKAMQKRKEHKNMIVIGVTGSYGKSSTKEYIAQILEKKFNVVKTKGTNNTPIGIADTILHSLKRNTEIFVVEMGAYKKGEITQLCAIAKPTIGVLTAVNMQHVSLFGSLKNTMEAKYELINALPKNGLALFNGNNENSKYLYNNPPEIFKNVKRKKILYIAAKGNYSLGGDITVFDIRAGEDEIKFSVRLRGKIMHFKAPVIGEHSVENILPAIYIAHYLGMREEEIIRAVTLLSPLPKTMTRHMLLNKVTLIDDTFNSNPQAAFSALSYMSAYRQKRIMVLQPMIELGQNASKEHYAVAKKISKTCNILFLTNKNFFSSLIRGIKDGGGTCIVKVATPSQISSFILKNTKKGDVVVFEGKEAANTLHRIL